MKPEGSSHLIEKMEAERALIRSIKKLKSEMGKSLVILGHHYQRTGIVDIADHIGDSFGLASKAASEKDAKNILFCGVRFMAESAAILCRDDQKVFHPEPEAGCPMADMAPLDSVEKCWSECASRMTQKIIPVTYMNSHAPLKAFTGKHGGLVCTSSNADLALNWAWKNGEKVLFFPDQHLGRNTGLKMGLSESEMCVYYPSKQGGGLPADLSKVRLILWNGNCPVHMKFYPRDLQYIRNHYPSALIAVHPECTKEVVELADFSGSTEGIVKWVESQPAQSLLYIGTEVNLVERLRLNHRDKKIEPLFRSLCPTMYKVNLGNVLETLKAIVDDRAEDKFVPIHSEMKGHAKQALERMLAL
jgi:quinolinate synthase